MKRENERSVPRLDIQGLRMIAVGAVIADHLFHWPSGGFVGVDVFFVISGFLITGLLLREWGRNGTISFWGFYRRRIKRIMPAAVLVVLMTVAAAYVLFSTVRFNRTVIDGVWATFFGANWNFAFQGTDYFAADQAVSPFQHYWSLAVEEQFYFVWPWLMLLIFWVIGRFLKDRESVQSAAHRTIFIAILTLTIASFAWALYESVTNPTMAYFSTFSRAWELGIGALIAVIANVFTRIPAMLRPILAWIGVVGIIVSYFIVTETSAFPAPGAALPVLSTALVIIAGTGGGQARFLWPLTNPVSRYIGDISYSLYLWHFPAIIFAGEIFHEGAKRYYALALAITALGAIASYHLVENPIRKSRWLEPRNTRRPLRVSIWSTATAIGCAAAIAMATIPSLSPFIASNDPATASDATPLTTENLETAIKDAANDTKWPTLTPSVDQLANDQFEAGSVNGCQTPENDGKRCGTLNPADSSKTVVVIGNSSAAAYMPAIRGVFEPRGWSVISLTKVACPFLAWTPPQADAETTKACDSHKREAVKTIKRIDPAIVISTNLYSDSVTGKQRVRAQARILNSIKGHTDKFVLLSSAPDGPGLEECKTRWSSPSDCLMRTPGYWRDIASGDEFLASRASDRYFVDAIDWYCTPDGECPSYVGNTPIKRDRTHLTTAFAKKISPVLENALEEAGVINKRH